MKVGNTRLLAHAAYTERAAGGNEAGECIKTVQTLPRRLAFQHNRNRTKHTPLRSPHI